MTRPKTRHIGSDRVLLDGDRLVVVSRVDMEGWHVGQHRASVIRFDGRTWRVTGTTTGADGAIHYALAPWRPGEQDLTGPEIDYTADYVLRRDQAQSLGHKRRRVTAALRLVTPFIGFLPARTKARLEAVYGVDPVSATFQSVFLELLTTIVSFAMTAIGVLLLAPYGVPPAVGAAIFVTIGFVAAIDGSVRYGRILREERPPPGFYEWLVRRQQ